MKSNQTKTMAATFRLTAARFALVGIAALCIAGCGKDEPPAEVNRRPSGDVMTEQKSEKTKAEAEAQRREQAVDPKGPDTGHFRIVRGGYWRGLAEWCRSGRRGYGHQKATDDRRGFRMAMDE